MKRFIGALVALWAIIAPAQAASCPPNGQPCINTITTDGAGNVLNPGAVTTTPGTLTLLPLDIATVTTGGTAVNAIAAGHATKGGLLITANAAGMCVDQLTTAGLVTGTPSSTICVAQNQPYNVMPSAHAVSVNSSGSNVSLSGGGAN